MIIYNESGKILKKIAIFGGTFDPVHHGHVAIATAILANQLANQVLILPSFTPPHKLGREIAGFRDRYNMLKLAFDGIENCEVSDFEFRLKLQKSYTIEVLELLEREYPDSELSLVIGGDSLKLLPTWHRAKELVDNYEIITYPRKSENLKIQELEEFFGIEKTQKLLKNMIKAPFYEISSTILKKTLENNENTGIFTIGKVLDYINAKKLYKKNIK